MMGYYCHCLPPIVVLALVLSYSSLPIITHSLATPSPSPSPKIKPNSWQNRISKALLDVDGARTPQSRFRLLQRAIEDPSFSQDIQRGINAVQEEGIGKGHPILIDALWPKGTLARDDIEGIQALVKSIPERLEEVKAEQQNAKSTLSDEDDSGNSNGNGNDNNIGLNFGLYQRMIQKEENKKQSKNVIQNSFRRVPKDVPTLAWSPITSFQSAVAGNDTNITVDIQKIPACRLMTTPLDSETRDDNSFTLKNMGRGLVRLSNYVLEQTEDVGMISSPFVVKGSNMYMYMDEDGFNTMERDVEIDADMDPSDGHVTIERWESRTFALLEFPGICTNGEIERQKNKLMEAIAITFPLESNECDTYSNLASDYKYSTGKGSWRISDDDVCVFQYNAPGTLPWRRRNQVGFLVEEIISATLTTDQDTATDDPSLGMGSASGGHTNTEPRTFLPDDTADTDGTKDVDEIQDENKNSEK